VLKDRFFVLTGSFGSVKSTLLRHLQLRGIRGVVEPARPILAQQRSVQGNGLPERDPRLFVELMFSRMLDTYQQSDALLEPILFDRGIPDILAYAALFGFEFPPGENAAISIVTTPMYSSLRPGSRSIARTTSARCRFPRRASFGNSVRAIYGRFGYTLIELPCVCVEERVDFIFRHLRTRACTGQPSHAITHD